MTSRYHASAVSEPPERALGNFHRMGGRGTFIRARLTDPAFGRSGDGRARGSRGAKRSAGSEGAPRPQQQTRAHARARACMHIATHARARARASPVSCRIFSGAELGPATSSPELDSESRCRISTWTAHPSHTCAATWPALLVARCVVRRTRQVYAVLDGSRGFYAPMAAPLWRSETG
jgi:hypothetical protein